jgi:hypothetical protein
MKVASLEARKASIIILLAFLGTFAQAHVKAV